MLNVKTFPVNPLEVNCYVISDTTKEACIIDCGCFHQEEWEVIKQHIISEGLIVKHLLNTHFHFDHIFGLGYVYEDFQLQPEGSDSDIFLYEDLEQQISHFLIPNFPHKPPPPLGTPLHHNDIISFGNHTLKVIATSGHTPGGLCFYCQEENCLFSGDTLFCGSIGRTDLPGGDYSQIIKSITLHLTTLPPETKVYPGHGPATTIERETKYNSYL